MRKQKSTGWSEIPPAKGRLRRQLMEMLGIRDAADLMVPRQGTVSYIRWTLERELERVAPWQSWWLHPTVEIKQITPGVAIAYLVGMWSVSTRQLEALQRAVDEAKPLGVAIILTLKSRKGTK